MNKGIKKLNQYLRKNNLTANKFGKEILGGEQNMVHKILRGVRTPSLRMATRIENETSGAVPAGDWLREVKDKRYD